MSDVLITSELNVDGIDLDSSLNENDMLIDTDIGSTTIIQTDPITATAEEVEGGVLISVTDYQGTTTGLVEKGQKGETGAAAGFGTVSATVDANVGTPSVVVTTSGADTAKNISFEFHNLKGEGNVSSVQGATGDVVLDIAYDEQSSVGLAEVGTAITSEPNYTPTGRVEQTLESVEFMTGATGNLYASCSNATLYLGFSLTPTKTTKTIPTSAAVFNGNGVNLIIKERQ